jgi:peptidoglycan/LPS O-acetylase OafA/YrhL
MLAGVSSFVPGMGLPPVGPWWFICFIMQFYAIWPLLRKLTVKFGWQGLVFISAACFLVSFFVNPVLAHSQINLFETPIGRMRVLCLGIIAARYPIRLNMYLAGAAVAIMVMGSKYQSVSYLASLSAVVFSMWLYAKTRPVLRRFRVLEQIGNYSLAIFLVNGIVRVPFVAFADTPQLELLLGCGSAVVTFAISAFFHYLTERAPERIAALPNRDAWTPPQPADVMAE